MRADWLRTEFSVPVVVQNGIEALAARTLNVSLAEPFNAVLGARRVVTLHVHGARALALRSALRATRLELLVHCFTSLVESIFDY